MSKGFTIVELVLVIAALGLLALAAIVFSPDVGSARVAAATRQVSSDISYAKAQAMATNVTHGVLFVSGGTYTVYRSTSATPLASPLTKQPMVITLSTSYPGVSILGTYRVEFDGFGRPTTGGDGGVEITDGTTARTIIVDANTGRVRVL